MPVITPPNAGMAEQASKNWYRSEALRKIIGDLTALHQDADESTVVVAQDLILEAIENLSKARRELDPRLNRVRLGS